MIQVAYNAFVDETFWHSAIFCLIFLHMLVLLLKIANKTSFFYTKNAALNNFYFSGTKSIFFQFFCSENS